MEIADELGFDWDKWLDRYVGHRWPETDSFLLRHYNGACVFLERIKARDVTIANQAGVTHQQVEAVRSLLDAGAAVLFFIESQYTTLKTGDSLAH